MNPYSFTPGANIYYAATVIVLISEFRPLLTSSGLTVPRFPVNLLINTFYHLRLSWMVGCPLIILKQADI